LRELGGDPDASGVRQVQEDTMSRHTHHRRLIAAAATAAALAAGAPAASARPIDSDRYASSGASQPARVTVVQAPGEQGLDWGDAGIGAAGMLALVLVGVGGGQALGAVSGRRRSSAHS
jgi:hypothetical protein